MTITDIVTNIDRRLAEAQAEVARLERARKALLTAQSAAAGSPSPSSSPSSRRAPRAPVSTAYQVVPVGKLTALLADSEGMRTRELSEATRGNPAQILALLKEQERAGQIRRTGTRGATRWRIVTDEDRIAARVAELESRSRRGRARKH